jgi:hypothetical protein
MAVPERLPDRLRAELGELARADLEALVAEARAEARAHVKALLRDAYTDALLEDVPARPERAEPGARADEGEGWWLYGIVRSDRQLPGAPAGVAGGRTRLVTAGPLAALVSGVPLSEFGERALRENLNDLGWLERTVRAHEAVLDAMLAGGSVVPMRVCTIYRGQPQLLAMLEERGELLLETLSQLDGRTEWGVKIVADRPRLEQRVRADSDEARALAAETAGRPEGGAYLARKKLDALVREEIDRTLTEVVREAHARLEEWAAASVVLPAQNRELAGYRGQMVFNGAYLVDDERSDAFARLVGELESQYAPLGLGFELTGPWPAYNFSGSADPAEVEP